MNSHWQKVAFCWSNLNPTKNTLREGSTLVAFSVWIYKRKPNRIWSSTNMKRMIKRHVLFSAWLISVKRMLRWQPGGLEFLSLGCSYITDAGCPAVGYLTLRRRAVLCKRPCRFAVFFCQCCPEQHQFSCGIVVSLQLTRICCPNAFAINRWKEKTWETEGRTLALLQWNHWGI